MRIRNRTVTRCKSLHLRHHKNTSRIILVYPSHVEHSSEDDLVYRFDFKSDGTVEGCAQIYTEGVPPLSYV